MLATTMKTFPKFEFFYGIKSCRKVGCKIGVIQNDGMDGVECHLVWRNWSMQPFFSMSLLYDMETLIR